MILTTILCVLVAQSCPALCNPMGCSPPRSSVHGISQARILEGVAISSSSKSSWPRDPTHVSYTGRRILHHWATKEAQNLWYIPLILKDKTDLSGLFTFCLPLSPKSFSNLLFTSRTAISKVDDYKWEVWSQMENTTTGLCCPDENPAGKSIAKPCFATDSFVLIIVASMLLIEILCWPIKLFP